MTENANTSDVKIHKPGFTPQFPQGPLANKDQGGEPPSTQEATLPTDNLQDADVPLRNTQNEGITRDAPLASGKAANKAAASPNPTNPDTAGSGNPALPTRVTPGKSDESHAPSP